MNQFPSFNKPLSFNIVGFLSWLSVQRKMMDEKMMKLLPELILQRVKIRFENKKGMLAKEHQFFRKTRNNRI